MKIGKVIKRLRLNRGWTRRELAQRAKGPTVRAIIKIEIEGHSNMELKTFYAIREAFGLDNHDEWLRTGLPDE